MTNPKAPRDWSKFDSELESLLGNDKKGLNDEIKRLLKGFPDFKKKDKGQDSDQ